MKFLASLALLFALEARAVCTNPTVRREWGQLSPTEKNGYIAAVKKLSARPRSNQYVDPIKMSSDDFSLKHANNAEWAHANAEFLVFHRAMLRRFEQAMESVGWTGGLVYLDEGAVPSTWAQLDLFSTKYFGTEGKRSRCLQDGQFSQQSGFVDLYLDGSTKRCISRCGSPSETLWDAQYIVDNVFSTATTYEMLRGDDTANYHGTGHMVMGGQGCDLGNAKWSPRDPLFYLHHTYVDKIYWKWQQLCSSYVTDYEGYLNHLDENGNPIPVDATASLDSWAGLTAADVFDTQNGNLLCYTYSKSKGDITDYSAATCPDGSVANTNPWAAQTPIRREQASTNEAVNALASKTDGSPTGARAFNLAVHNATGVEVDCNFKLTNYTIPSGCEVHKVFCSHISLKPMGYKHDPATPNLQVLSHKAAKCPLVLRANKCDKIPVYERPAGYHAPNVTSKYQYPTPMTDEAIRERLLDLCAIRASDIKVMKRVDELNNL
ncbi:hypothetical protein BC830DRAFT_1076966 [Chytriomyces sp. MP71]|nr:hypothetical protein BC830DRAFT_1076966 [Chytriomyces sp. MP71]